MVRGTPLAICLLWSSVCTGLSAGEIDYLRDVQPILQANCFGCHGRLEQESELRLDTAEHRLTGGYSGPSLVPGDSGASLIVERVLDADDATRMPQGRPPLSSAEIAILRDWIDGGAVAPPNEELALASQHWAFQPITPAAVPESAGDWGRNAIDRWIARGHAEQGLAPRPPADPATLLRRVYLDLVGLPPTRDELQAFLADPSDEAYEQVVDRLLNSPQYGERWGRHWMDVWRYSDWAGYRDEIRESQRHIWRWRDWIVESLNDDLGYDQMVFQMLAADELMPTDESALRATGFLARNWYKFNRNVWLDNTVEHTAKAFLGLTFNCAKCHDHMYDPISQADYYRLRAFFEPHQVRTDRLPGQSDLVKDGLPRAYDGDASVPTFLFVRGDEAQPDKGHPLEPGLPEFFCPQPLDIEPVELPTTAYYPAVKPFIQQETLTACAQQIEQAQQSLVTANATLAAAQQRQSELAQTAGAEVAEDEAAISREVEAAQWAATEAEQAVVAAQTQLAACVARIAADNARVADAPADAHAAQLAAAAGRAEAQAALASAEQSVAAAQRQLALARHALNEQDAKTQQAVTTAETKLAEAEKQLATSREAAARPNHEYTPLDAVYPATSTGRRSALARWIVDANNPLAARVAVNHIWLRHFGQPLVASVFDFGLHGEQPAQPELLDWLAAEFVASGWSQKALHRLIVTSSTYRLDSSSDEALAAIDPDNRHWWRMPSRRMEAEVVRDSLLHVTGALDLTLGGPDLDQDLGQTSRRRSLYFRHANEKQMTFLELFDAASVNECYRRSESIAPQQSLALTNSPLALAQARRLARQLDAELAEQPAATFVTWAFQSVLSRMPSADELTMCEEFLATQSELLAGAETLHAFDTGGQCEVPPSDDPRLRARESLVHVLLSHHDFVTIR